MDLCRTMAARQIRLSMVDRCDKKGTIKQRFELSAAN